GEPTPARLQFRSADGGTTSWRSWSVRCSIWRSASRSIPRSSACRHLVAERRRETTAGDRNAASVGRDAAARVMLLQRPHHIAILARQIAGSVRLSPDEATGSSGEQAWPIFSRKSTRKYAASGW